MEDSREINIEKEVKKSIAHIPGKYMMIILILAIAGAILVAAELGIGDSLLAAVAVLLK